MYVCSWLLDCEKASEGLQKVVVDQTGNRRSEDGEVERAPGNGQQKHIFVVSTDVFCTKITVDPFYCKLSIRCSQSCSPVAGAWPHPKRARTPQQGPFQPFSEQLPSQRCLYLWKLPYLSKWLIIMGENSHAARGLNCGLLVYMVSTACLSLAAAAHVPLDSLSLSASHCHSR
jgi:hypothetical protein